ncbi:MAG: serine/threonine protein kinase [Candidatus Paceibacteria bacterium]|jgi:serine/threonine protein kinase
MSDMNSMESIETGEKAVDLEQVAEHKLNAILDNPDNAFLIEHSLNIDSIENAESSVESLRIAEEIIYKRLEAMSEVHRFALIEDFEKILVDLRGLKEKVDSVIAEQEMIGEGQDGYVLIAKSEVQEGFSEVCYKVAKRSKVNPRSKNSLSEEVKIHDDVYELNNELGDSCIGVPALLYSAKLDRIEFIAMERLPAKSMQDISDGDGVVPDWIDVEVFCRDLKKLIDKMHSKGLYHRDLHLGNIMVSQYSEPPEDGKSGYMIDFGLSAYVEEGEDPYSKKVKERNLVTDEYISRLDFTYLNDDALITKVKKFLESQLESKKARQI